MDVMWTQENKMSKYMYLIGKYRNKKNATKLSQTVDKIKKQYKSLRSAWRKTDMNWSQFQKCTKLYKRKDDDKKPEYIRKLESGHINSIKSFFQSDETSFPLPDKKYVGKRFMKRSLKKTWKMYNLLNSTTRKISVSTFRKYKPTSVKLQGKIPFRQSCCEVCQNFEFVMEQACKYLQGIPRNIDDCIDSSMCPYEKYFPKLKCALRECSLCGTNNLKLRLTTLNSDKLNDNRKRFLVKQWENKKERIPGTDKVKTYMHWRHDRLSYKGLLDVYVNLLKDMASHSFFASWNFHQYLVCKNNIEEGQVIIVHDFAQNYLCVHQHEPQGLHWSHKQVTIHPSCISYRCPVDDCNQVVLHEIVHISDDGKHDAHLVKKFQIANMQILQRRGVQIRKIIEFTDQAPSQYKNKSAFRYLSENKTPTMRNFFGVRHGKGPCDACAGRVKSGITNLVKTQQCVINNATTCFEAAKANLESQWPGDGECKHYMLTFHFTKKNSKRPDTKKWSGVKDTRAHMHSIMNTGKKLQVNVRDIICLCPGCLHGDSECKNTSYLDNWRGFDMHKFEDIPEDLTLWKSIKIRKIVGCREEYNWTSALRTLGTKTSFNDLQEYVKKNPLPFLDCHIDENLSQSETDHLDLVALHYKPHDAPEGYAPCKIIGDGNCFPRALSYICFKNQDSHKEMRVRLVYEAVLNGKYYLSNRYLCRGCNIIYRGAGPCKQLAMYSSSYNPTQELDVVNIYKKEVLEIARDSAYCGLWQMSQASNILRRPVLSVYPTNLHEGMRLDFNRSFMCIDNRYNDRTSVKIMWTPMQVSENSYPVHFVPLLKAVSLLSKIYVNYVLINVNTCFN